MVHPPYFWLACALRVAAYVGLLMPPDAPLHIYASPMYYALDQVAQKRCLYSTGVSGPTLQCPPMVLTFLQETKVGNSTFSTPRGAEELKEIFCGPTGRRAQTRGTRARARLALGVYVFYFVFCTHFRSILCFAPFWGMCESGDRAAPLQRQGATVAWRSAGRG